MLVRNQKKNTSVVIDFMDTSPADTSGVISDQELVSMHCSLHFHLFISSLCQEIVFLSMLHICLFVIIFHALFTIYFHRSIYFHVLILFTFLFL